MSQVDQNIIITCSQCTTKTKTTVGRWSAGLNCATCGQFIERPTADDPDAAGAGVAPQSDLREAMTMPISDRARRPVIPAPTPEQNELAPTPEPPARATLSPPVAAAVPLASTQPPPADLPVAAAEYPPPADDLTETQKKMQSTIAALTLAKEKAVSELQSLHNTHSQQIAKLEREKESTRKSLNTIEDKLHTAHVERGNDESNANILRTTLVEIRDKNKQLTEDLIAATREKTLIEKTRKIEADKYELHIRVTKEKVEELVQERVRLSDQIEALSEASTERDLLKNENKKMLDAFKKQEATHKLNAEQGAEEKEQAEIRIKAAHAKLEELVREKLALTSKLTELNDASKSLAVRAATSKNSHNQQKKKIMSLTVENRLLREKLEQFGTKITDQSRAIKSKDQDLQKLAQERDMVVGKEKKTGEQFIELAGKSRILEVEHKDLTGKFAELNKKKDSLEKIEGVLKDELVQMTESVAALKQNLQNDRDEHEALTVENTTIWSKIDELSAELDGREKELKAEKTTSHGQSNQLEKLTAELDEVTTARDDLKVRTDEEIRRAREAIEKTAEEGKRLESQLAEREGSLERAETDARQYNQHAQEIRQQAEEELKKAKDETQNLRQELDDVVKRSRTEEAKRNAEIQGLRGEHKEQGIALERAAAELEELKNRLRLTDAEQSATDDDIREQLREEIERLRNAAEQQRSDADEWKEKAAVAEKQNTELASVQDAAAAKSQTLQTERDRLQKELAAAKAPAAAGAGESDELERLKLENDVLQSKIEELILSMEEEHPPQKDVDGNEREAGAAAEQLERLTIENEVLLSKLDELVAKAKDDEELASKNEQLKEELEALRLAVTAKDKARAVEPGKPPELKAKAEPGPKHDVEEEEESSRPHFDTMRKDVEMITLKAVAGSKKSMTAAADESDLLEVSSVDVSYPAKVQEVIFGLIKGDQILCGGKTRHSLKLGGMMKQICYIAATERAFHIVAVGKTTFVQTMARSELKDTTYDTTGGRLRFPAEATDNKLSALAVDQDVADILIAIFRAKHVSVRAK